jgi:hypothetical protein
MMWLVRHRAIPIAVNSVSGAPNLAAREEQYIGAAVDR